MLLCLSHSNPVCQHRKSPSTLAYTPRPGINNARCTPLCCTFTRKIGVSKNQHHMGFCVLLCFNMLLFSFKQVEAISDPGSQILQMYSLVSHAHSCFKGRFTLTWRALSVTIQAAVCADRTTFKQVLFPFIRVELLRRPQSQSLCFAKFQYSFGNVCVRIHGLDRAAHPSISEQLSLHGNFDFILEWRIKMIKTVASLPHKVKGAD